MDYGALPNGHTIPISKSSRHPGASGCRPAEGRWNGGTDPPVHATPPTGSLRNPGRRSCTRQSYPCQTVPLANLRRRSIFKAGRFELSSIFTAPGLPMKSSTSIYLGCRPDLGHPESGPGRSSGRGRMPLKDAIGKIEPGRYGTQKRLSDYKRWSIFSGWGTGNDRRGLPPPDGRPLQTANLAKNG